ncbi:MAG TPA: ribonuclease J [Acidobacteriota bacterium]|nr:ribonuclease J [Acidobacteriota bacterium]
MENIEVVPLGGVGEFGMNCSVLRCNDTAILVDAGMTFPRSDKGSELGVNVVVPEIDYLHDIGDQLKAIFLTHGHEDHIGAVSYVVEEINVPVYGSALTLGLVENRLKERKLDSQVDLRTMKARERIEMGDFTVEPIRVTHSFPESFAFAIECSAGRILWTGDFKFDQTPIDGVTSDLHRLAAHGEKGVLALFSDSTNSHAPGLCPSEHSVWEPMRALFRKAEGKVVVSCFSSSIHRMQIILDLAQEFGRKVALAGRSLNQNLHKASDLGYLKVPPDVLINANQIDNYHPHHIILMAAGSQGEPMSAMSRLALDEFRETGVGEGDVVILSTRVIPGNEMRIGAMVDHFYRRGARVVMSGDANIHASGHGFREDLKLMISLIRPKYFIPIHGDYRQLKEHTVVAQEQGIAPANIHLIENGNVLRISKEQAEVVDQVHAGRRFIDEGYTGEVHELVLRDRRFLSEDGFLVVVLRMDRFAGELIGDPEIISRGFILMEDAEELLEEAKQIVLDTIEETPAEKLRDEDLFKELVRKRLKRFLRKKTGKRPMILPVTLEI